MGPNWEPPNCTKVPRSQLQYALFVHFIYACREKLPTTLAEFRYDVCLKCCMAARARWTLYFDKLL